MGTSAVGVRRPNRIAVTIAVALALLASSMAFSQLRRAGAQVVANPGAFAMSIIGGNLAIKDTTFNLTPSPLAQCEDGKNNDDDQDLLVDFPADPQCSAANDNSELASGFQPKEDITITGTIDADGNIEVPTNGVSFPPSYIFSSELGVITVRIQPTHAATGTLDPLSGQADIRVRVRIKLEGGSGLTALGSSCFVGSSSSPIDLILTTGTTAPPAPNTPISGVPYDADTGVATMVNNSFGVIGASGCALLGLANGPINEALGLPSTAGNNTAVLVGQVTPAIQRGVNAVIGGGTFRDDEAPRTISFDGSASNAIDGPIASYLWDFGDGTTSTDAVTTHDYEPGYYAATLTVTDQVGDSHTATQLIRVGPAVPPVAVATADPTSGDRPLTVEFDSAGSTASQGGLTYSWDFGDGSDPVTGPTAEHTYTSIGTKTATLTVTDIDGVTSTDTVDIQVNNVAPVASFTMEPGSLGVVPQEVALDATASSDADGTVESYAWDFGNGDTGTGATTTYTYTEAGTYTVTLTVTDNDGGTSSTSRELAVAAENTPPVADAGPDQTGRRSAQTVTLTAAGSSDADQQALTYSWEQVSGHPATLSNPNAVSPTFVVPPAPDFVYPHDLVFQVTVTDSRGASTTDTVSVGVIATAPTVGTPVRTPTTAPCLGSLRTWSAPISANPDGWPVESMTWAWTISRDAANVPSFGPLDSATPVMQMPAITRTTSNGPRVRATVSVGAELPGGPFTSALSAESATFAVAACARPVANAGPDQSVATNSTVTLAGSGTQTQGKDLTLLWTQTGGTPVELDDPTSATPSFTAPSSAGDLTFQLVATDPTNPTAGTGTNGNTSLPDSVTVTVVRGAPVADAGADQSGVVVGETVTLDGSGSSAEDDAELSYAWSQVSGPSVTLDDASSVSPSFTAPGGPATLVFSLVVNDGFASSVADEVSVSVSNSAPVADAGEDQSVSGGETVTLDGSASSDPDGQELSFEWVQVAGDPVTLDDATSPSPSFVAPESGGTFEFELTVSDGEGGEDTDSVVIEVEGLENMSPSASFIATPSGGDAPLEVSVDASASEDPDGTIVSYEWDFGNGETGTGETASVTYTEAGTYTITLVVTDDQGATGTATVEVVVSDVPVENLAPSASIIATPSAGEAPLEVSVDGSGSEDPDGTIVSYEWDFGNGETGTGETASVTYTEAGTYTITLVVTDDQGATGTATTEIVVDEVAAVTDRVSLRITGARAYEYDGPINSGDLKITRDLFGVLRISGTGGYPGVNSGSASVRFSLDRFLIFNAYGGQIRIQDASVSGMSSLTTEAILVPLSGSSSTRARGTAYWNVGLGKDYTLRFGVEDLA